MEIKVKRNTGVIGFLLNIKLDVDCIQYMVELSNKESYLVQTDNESVKISAKMWPFSSKPLEVKRSEMVEVVTNPIAIIMYVVSLFLIFLGGFNSDPTTKLILSSIGLVAIIITLVYSFKNWFIVRII